MSSVKFQHNTVVNPKSALNIIILGCPLSGKTSVCTSIRDTYNLGYFLPEDLLKQRAINGSPDSDLIFKSLSNGDTLPDDYMVPFMKQELSNSSNSFGYLLDGFPNTAVQASQMFHPHAHAMWKLPVPDIVIVLDTPGEVAKDRAVTRRVDPVSNLSYDSKDVKVPANVKARLQKKMTDNEETILKNVMEFEKSIDEILFILSLNKQTKIVTVESSFSDIDTVQSLTLSHIAGVRSRQLELADRSLIAQKVASIPIMPFSLGPNVGLGKRKIIPDMLPLPRPKTPEVDDKRPPFMPLTAEETLSLGGVSKYVSKQLFTSPGDPDYDKDIHDADFNVFASPGVDINQTSVVSNFIDDTSPRSPSLLQHNFKEIQGMNSLEKSHTLKNSKSLEEPQSARNHRHSERNASRRENETEEEKEARRQQRRLKKQQTLQQSNAAVMS